MDEILLVDENDNVIGFEEKLEVHRSGLLHRAFSILIFNSKGEMLIQKRARSKYHSGGLWTNACCSHQRKGELLDNEIHKRLKEEVGIDCSLKEIYTLKYYVKFENGLIENEYDHVFIGICDGRLVLNYEEVEECQWVNLDYLKEDLSKNNFNYTFWFKIIMDKYFKLNKNKNGKK